MTEAQPPHRQADGGGRRWRVTFAVYAAALMVGLFWPALQVPEVIPRPDLIAHGVTFGGLTWLGYRALREGACRPGWALVLAALGGIAFGGVTELIQGLPIIRRSSAWDDFFADVFGVALGMVAAVVTTLWAKRTRTGSR